MSKVNFVGFDITDKRQKIIPVMSDITGKELVNELRKLRGSITSDRKDNSNKTTFELEQYIAILEGDIEDYKTRIDELESKLSDYEYKYNNLSNRLNEYLNSIIKIFFKNDSYNKIININYDDFMRPFIEALDMIKNKHKRFFKQNLLFCFDNCTICRITKNDKIPIDEEICNYKLGYDD